MSFITDTASSSELTCQNEEKKRNRALHEEGTVALKLGKVYDLLIQQKARGLS